MAVTISDDILQATHFTAPELKIELAVWLFAQDRLTLAQAVALADMPWLTFQHLLASRNITPHYDVAEFEHDMLIVRQWEQN